MFAWMTSLYLSVMPFLAPVLTAFVVEIKGFTAPATLTDRALRAPRTARAHCRSARVSHMVSSPLIGVIVQPSYVPWRGFFDLIHRADVFVFYDDVQYDKHGWRNRNRIKTPSGSQWLTIPVSSKGNVTSGLLLSEARIVWAQDWPRKHAMTLRHCYHRAPFFSSYTGMLDSFYASRPDRLVDFTIETTVALAHALGIAHTRFVRSSNLGV